MAGTDWARVLANSIKGASSHTKGVFGGSHAMSPAEVLDFLRQSQMGLVSTVTAAGTPHITGATFVLVDDRLYFGTGVQTALYRHLQRRPYVALGVVEPPWRRHVLIQGSVRFLAAEGDEGRRVRAAQRTKYGWEYPILAELIPEKVFTWKM